MNIGEVINGYTILEHFVPGGMGFVSKVRKNGENYALKTCICSDEVSIKRFNREIRLMEAIQHENVITVLDKIEIGGVPCFVMPLCDMSLDEAIKAGITDDKKFEYAKQLCLGVKAIHDAGEVHRDIKPNNALILGDKVKVSDLGLGKFVDRDSPILTPTNTLVGSYGYIPPEIYINGKGRDADSRSDIYSIGCLLYFMFSDGYSPLHIDSSKVKADVFAIIAKCMKIAPSDRYQNVSDIIRDLNICEQSRKTPITIKEAISHYRKGINDRQFFDQLYIHLLTLQNDFKGLINDLQTIGVELFKELVKYEKENVSNLINLLLNAYNNGDCWIQFSDVEVLVGRARVLFNATSLLQEKERLLEFSIKISNEYTRYSAMEIVGRMLNDLSEEEMKMMAVFFQNNKDEINVMKEAFKTSIPSVILAFLR
ncbi:serine/threonine-protein kinase [uncultured Bacteroides sp.]|uniref:serine/threonine-protein kinase n=1 Tax=uncultured Bacteroides sp. TaxID=162156 RepID=UPI002AAC0E2D|nr:serine/threonine-protein kinase [uncultured Bacteroides sp.]